MCEDCKGPSGEAVYFCNNKGRNCHFAAHLKLGFYGTAEGEDGKGGHGSAHCESGATAGGRRAKRGRCNYEDCPGAKRVKRGRYFRVEKAKTAYKCTTCDVFYCNNAANGDEGKAPSGPRAVRGKAKGQLADGGIEPRTCHYEHLHRAGRQPEF